ncbi:alpha-L-arabinofuranosidase C-terminal domain-containing protein [Balneolaceae bacterium ANBcel3]|nr:alpha-L-arabinofuranosidase C-terminal domain-containing protein [Balneolaceae bacterium ANBcel3]
MFFISMIVFSGLQASPSEEGKPISGKLFGLFFEDINYAADGGLYAEMVQNRSFEYSPTEQPGWNPLAFWEYIDPGFSIGRIHVQTNEPIHPNNPTYIVLDVEVVGNYPQHEGESGVGLKNHGFGGMVVREGENYHFSLFGRLLSDQPVNLRVSLEDPEGELISEESFQIHSKDWEKYETSLTAIASHDSAYVQVLIQSPGELALDMISLFPENTFKNRKNGLRADLAQVLADMKPRFLRFPGGCLVHGDGLGNMYRWKNTVGPVEERKAQRNIWGYHQTGGFGFFEFIQFSEDLGAIPIPILPAAVSCQNSGGTHVIGGAGQKALCLLDMEEYIQDIFDLIEWANGPETSKWGAVRAQAGRSEPFGLTYIGIGNEDKKTPEFIERFTMIYNAVKEKHPEIEIIGSSGPFSEGEDFEKGWELANRLGLSVVDEHYYQQTDWYIANQNRYDGYDRKASSVYLGEYASWGNTLYNAIVEAAYMTSLERNGDLVIMASYAPLLAKRDFNQWSTNLIYFDNVNIVPTPNYYVQKMFMTNQGDYYHEGVVALASDDVLVAASVTTDGQKGDVILKLVNLHETPREMPVDLSRFSGLVDRAVLTVLAGEPTAENTFNQPVKITPVQSEMHINKTFTYQAPPMSLSILRIGRNK